MKNKNTRRAAIIGLFALLSTPLASAPVSPVEKISVASETFQLVDFTREEIATAEIGDPRKLVVQLWYPSIGGTGSGQLEYIQHRKQLIESESLSGRIASMDLDVEISGDLMPASQPYPLVILSHGLNMDRWALSSLSQGLAKRGFVVAAISHPYWAGSVAFTSDEIFEKSASFSGRTFEDRSIRALHLREGIETLAADQAFVANSIIANQWPSERLNKKFSSKLDRSRVAVAGHSLGGMAADTACSRAILFKACINYDGARFERSSTGRYPQKVAKPHMILVSSAGVDFYRRSPDLMELGARYEGDWLIPTFAELDKSEHFSFTDWPILQAPDNLESRAHHDSVIIVTTSFLNAAFKGQAFNLEQEAIPGINAITPETIMSRPQKD